VGSYATISTRSSSEGRAFGVEAMDFMIILPSPIRKIPRIYAPPILVQLR
jgi:hypothetical protein